MLGLVRAQAFDLGDAYNFVNSVKKELNAKGYEGTIHTNRKYQSSSKTLQRNYSEGKLARKNKINSKCDQIVFSDSSGKPNETSSHKQTRYDCLVQASQNYDRSAREKRRELKQKRGETPEKHKKDLIIMGLDPKKEIDDYDLTPDQRRSMDNCYSKRMGWKSSDRMNYCGYTSSQ